MFAHWHKISPVFFKSVKLISALQRSRPVVQSPPQSCSVVPHVHRKSPASERISATALPARGRVRSERHSPPRSLAGRYKQQETQGVHAHPVIGMVEERELAPRCGTGYEATAQPG